MVCGDAMGCHSQGACLLSIVYQYPGSPDLDRRSALSTRRGAKKHHSVARTPQLVAKERRCRVEAMFNAKLRGSEVLDRQSFLEANLFSDV